MNIVRFFVCFVLIIGLVGSAAAADEAKPLSASTALPEVKLGIVDFRRVAQESAAGKKATVLLKELTEKYQSSLNAKGKELEKKKKSLEEKAKGLTPAKLQAREKELQKKFQEYQEFGRNAELELRKKEAELSDTIGEKLLEVVKEYGSKNGYAAIVRKDNLVYTDSKYETKDLTDEILKAFDAAGTK